MNRRLTVAALACSLVLAGCLGGSAGSPDSTTVETTATTQTTTAATETTRTAETTDPTTTAERPRHRTYDTREALAANASFTVPEPNVSEPFAFESGVAVDLANGEYVAMAYHDTENGSLENVVSIRKAVNESHYDSTAGNATTVGDRDARYVAEDSDGKFLWQCNGYVYRVSVQQFTDEFGESELRAVAESVGCE
ncbi:hypothetical protein M0R89_02135 [Halorussus limi]|uniref:DUF4367 domain-containing protein n=1 Tax=Halorussus limi TaxID=2938695 RepID=A0A8U0HVZ7_9EURY|nr:hypothetical protein [Halorussus limi]UPV74881.1 hypothetical protein M0R89_02135 [Halorussus limi]